MLFRFACEWHKRMTVIGKRTVELRETPKLLVLLGNDEVGRAHRPGNGNVRVVPPYSTVASGCVIVGDLVHHQDILGEGKEAMRKAHRNIDLLAGLGRNLDCD